jgi:CRP-like cAMP-binding protein
MQTPEYTSIAKFVARLDRCGPLSDAGRAALLALPTQTKSWSIYQDIVRDGDRPKRSCMVETGLVSRNKVLRDGSRQIVSFHIPGDMVDLQSALVVVADHSIHTHMATTIVSVAHEDILDVAEKYPEIGRAFWFDTLLDAAVFREWTVNVGRRNSRSRTAHLLLELAARYETIGLLQDDTFPLPISQADLSDALGMTAVHLNRTLQWMRGERYIRTHRQTMTIEDWDEMRQLAGFSRDYLHPEGPRQPNAVLVE